MNKSEELYFEEIDVLAGGSGRYIQISPAGEEPSVSIVSYKDIPETGEITSFSYGLSSRDRPEWKFAKPELLISVRSNDDSWGQCMGEVIYRLGPEGRLSYGTMLNFGEQVSDESEMRSFLVFACSLLVGDEAKIVLPDRTIHLAQLYPIHKSEVEIVHRAGVERFFFDMGIDFSDVKRPAITL